MPEFICEFCSNEFTAKSSLNRHMKRARYCLELQGKEQEKIVCGCGKSFTRKDSLKFHQTICTFKELKTESSSEMMQVVEKVLDTLKDIAKTPTTTTTIKNTNNLNLQPITYQYIEAEGNKHLTEQIVMEGRQPEIASKVFNGYITVADKSRKKIKYTDEEGNLSTNSKKLVQNFYEAIQTKNKELADKLYGDIQTSVNELIAQGRVSDSNFTQLLMSGTNLQDRLIAIKNLTDGITDDNSTKLLDETIKCIINKD